jgi:hypothetical protein
MIQWFVHAPKYDHVSSVSPCCNSLAMQQNYGRNMEAIIAGKFTGMNKARNA